MLVKILNIFISFMQGNFAINDFINVNIFIYVSSSQNFLFSTEPSQNLKFIAYKLIYTFFLS